MVQCWGNMMQYWGNMMQYCCNTKEILIQYIASQQYCCTIFSWLSYLSSHPSRSVRIEGEVDPSSVTNTSVRPAVVVYPPPSPPANVRSTLACLGPSPTLCPPTGKCPRVSVQVPQLLLLATDQWQEYSVRARITTMQWIVCVPSSSSGRIVVVGD